MKKRMIPFYVCAALISIQMTFIYIQTMMRGWEQLLNPFIHIEAFYYFVTAPFTWLIVPLAALFLWLGSVDEK